MQCAVQLPRIQPDLEIQSRNMTLALSVMAQDAVCLKGLMASKNEVIVKLKEELDAAIRLVVHSRESLDNELNNEWAAKKLSVDEKFLKKLQQLTASFNSLTESKIRLDKAEKSMERELTAAEELEAVKSYLVDMVPSDLVQLVKEVREVRGVVK